MAPHSSTVARKIPWMEKPGRLQSRPLLNITGLEHNNSLPTQALVDLGSTEISQSPGLHVFPHWCRTHLEANCCTGLDTT